MRVFVEFAQCQLRQGRVLPRPHRPRVLVEFLAVFEEEMHQEKEDDERGENEINNPAQDEAATETASRKRGVQGEREGKCSPTKKLTRERISLSLPPSKTAS